MDLIFGREIASIDSWIGNLDGVWMNTHGNLVSHIVLRRGFPISHRYLALADTINRTDSDGCYLDMSTEAALVLPNLREAHHDTTKVILGKGSRMTLEHGLRLRLVGLRLTDEKVVTHVLAERQWPAKVVRLIPIDSISEMSPWRVTTDLSPQEFRNLPTYRPDREVERAVQEALFANKSISDTDLNSVAVRVDGGTATLIGTVRWPDIVRDIDETICSVPGVAEVDNRLVNDRDIELRIAAIMSGIDSVLADSAEVDSQLGDVTITGNISSDEVSGRVQESVADLVGVLSVTLDLIVTELVAVTAVSSGSEEISTSGDNVNPTQS
jgi:osmotically-inducible protein OsmY